MKTNLKTSFLVLAFVIFSAILFSFSKTEKNAGKRFGGTASVIVEVDFSKVPNGSRVFILQQQGIKEGDRRVIEVSVDCYKDSYSDVERALQDEISYDKQDYEKSVSSISYDISSCE